MRYNTMLSITKMEAAALTHLPRANDDYSKSGAGLANPDDCNRLRFMLLKAHSISEPLRERRQFTDLVAELV